MGLISKLKSMFKKNIDCSSELNNSPVHFYTTSNRIVSLGSTIIVKEGYSAVMVCKDRVTDILPEGKHKFDNMTIPNTFKVMKLYKIDQNGKSAKSFKCDFYFVNNNIIENFEFLSNIPLLLKKDPLGRVEAYAEGMCDIKITDAEMLITYLLIENAYIKDKKATSEISFEVGNVINKQLEKINMTFEEILSNINWVNSTLNNKLQTSYEYMGIQINNLKIHSFSMPAKLQKKVEALNLNKINKNNISGDLGALFNNGIEIPFAENIGIEEKQPLNVEVENENQKISNENDFEQNESFKNVNFNTNLYKTCNYCKARINANAKFCENCGYKQE